MPFITHQLIVQDIILHSVFNILFSAVIFLTMKKLIYVFIFILAGYLLDLDHLIDHFLYFRNKFNLKDLFYLEFLESNKVYYLFHSWEINCLLFILSKLLNSDILFIVALSLTVHVAIDSSQKKNPFFYFLTYRIMKKFRARELIPEYVQRKTWD